MSLRAVRSPLAPKMTTVQGLTVLRPVSSRQLMISSNCSTDSMQLQWTLRPAFQGQRIISGRASRSESGAAQEFRAERLLLRPTKKVKVIAMLPPGGCQLRICHFAVRISADVVKFHFPWLRHVAWRAGHRPGISAGIPGQSQEPSHPPVALSRHAANQTGD